MKNAPDVDPERIRSYRNGRTSMQGHPAEKNHRRNMGLCRRESPNPQHQIAPWRRTRELQSNTRPGCPGLYLRGHRFDYGFSGSSRTGSTRERMSAHSSRNHVMHKRVLRPASMMQVSLRILVPQQLQGDPLSPEFVMDVRPAGNCPMRGHLLRLGTPEQPPLQFGVGDVVR